MIDTQPTARIIARPQVDWEAIWEEFIDMGYGTEWWHSRKGTPTDLAEFMGRLCYAAFADTDNQNVTRMRNDQDAYFANLIKQGHTSVFEHLSWTFALKGSRLLTHELVRHRPGVAISQESGRYVRFHNDDMGWIDVPTPPMPDHIVETFRNLRETYMAELQDQIDTLPWDKMPFKEKKEITSWLRRSFPEGRATRLGWTANARTLRHVIALRTAPGAEVEIRLLFGQVADMMAKEAPLIFQDMKTKILEDGTKSYYFEQE